MSALTVKELIGKLSHVQSDRVVVLRIMDEKSKSEDGSRACEDTFTIIDQPSILLKNAHPVEGGERDVVEIDLVATAP